MKTFQREVQLRTAGGLTVTDITDDVRAAVRESGIADGICCVYSPHTTCSVRINEWERGFLEDFAVMLKRLVPTEHYYAHDDWDRRTENVTDEDQEFGNGHSHCMLDPNWREVGVAAMRASSAGGIFGGGATWVVTMDFGVRSGTKRTTASKP